MSAPSTPERLPTLPNMRTPAYVEVATSAPAPVTPVLYARSDSNALFAFNPHRLDNVIESGFAKAEFVASMRDNGFMPPPGVRGHHSRVRKLRTTSKTLPHYWNKQYYDKPLAQAFLLDAAAKDKFEDKHYMFDRPTITMMNFADHLLKNPVDMMTVAEACWSAMSQ